MGPYRIIEQYRRGGMATVYRAQHVKLSRQVAVKVIRTSFLGESEYADYAARFRREALTVAQLRHPNILGIFTYGEAQGMPYLVTEFVDGGTLADRLGAPIPVDTVIRLLGPIAAALDYAHNAGVLHRDVKPSNILLWSNGSPVLGDFGIAKRAGAAMGLTKVGQVMGTPEYMAPEQALSDDVGPASDQYALAVVAYEMLTGRVPYSGETPLAVLMAHMQRPLPPPRSINPALSPTVEAVLLKALAKRPGERYPSVAAFIDALDQANSAKLPSAPPFLRWLVGIRSRFRGRAAPSR
jgi:serine/threonine-protein kinase